MQHIQKTQYVECDFCKTKHYKLISYQHSQADKCASSKVFRKNDSPPSYISCHYGSSFDTLRFIMKKNSPNYEKVGNICDLCIQHMIETSEIKEDENFNFTF
jgi:hypothetical protein